jgi:hypothetical protein
LVRLPLFNKLKDSEIYYIVDKVLAFQINPS